MFVVLALQTPEESIVRIEEVLRAAGAEPRRAQGSNGAIALIAHGVSPSVVDGLPYVSQAFAIPSPYPRAAINASRERTVVHVGNVRIGGGSPPVVIAGPCAVESEAQLESLATLFAALDVPLLRGGAFKPRTSPYSFAGLGSDGLRVLRAVADRHGLRVVTEVMDPADVSEVASHADMLQVGSRNMQNFPLLRALGRAARPVLLKRGMSATLEEWLLAAEYILEAGNPNVVLCERGVRSFDPAARNLLDLAAVPLLQLRTHLPVLVDPSHGVGVRAAVGVMACASIAAGADGVMIEVHPSPGTARSDGYQALSMDEFRALLPRVRNISQGP